MLTGEKRKEKFQKLINSVNEIKDIIKEFNEQSWTLDNCERILGVTIYCDMDSRVHLVGFGDEEVVDVVNLDKEENFGKTKKCKRNFTKVDNVMVFQIKEYEE